MLDSTPRTLTTAADGNCDYTEREMQTHLFFTEKIILPAKITILQ